ncbi:MAG: hypothetical protein ACK5PW_08880 [Burkholderiales bacterium]|jgi:predicted MPP superfamily phosphohydrolase
MVAIVDAVNRLEPDLVAITGYCGPPERFGAPSEITRLRLIAAPAIG